MSVALPEVARCPEHADAAAVGTCERCGRFVCAGCRAQASSLCTTCANLVARADPLLTALAQPLQLIAVWPLGFRLALRLWRDMLPLTVIVGGLRAAAVVTTSWRPEGFWGTPLVPMALLFTSSALGLIGASLSIVRLTSTASSWRLAWALPVGLLQAFATAMLGLLPLEHLQLVAWVPLMFFMDTSIVAQGLGPFSRARERRALGRTRNLAAMAATYVAYAGAQLLTLTGAALAATAIPHFVFKLIGYASEPLADATLLVLAIAATLPASVGWTTLAAAWVGLRASAADLPSQPRRS